MPQYGQPLSQTLRQSQTIRPKDEVHLNIQVPMGAVTANRVTRDESVWVREKGPFQKKDRTSAAKEEARENKIRSIGGSIISGDGEDTGKRFMETSSSEFRAHPISSETHVHARELKKDLQATHFMMADPGVDAGHMSTISLSKSEFVSHGPLDRSNALRTKQALMSHTGGILTHAGTGSAPTKMLTRKDTTSADFRPLPIVSSSHTAKALKSDLQSTHFNLGHSGEKDFGNDPFQSVSKASYASRAGHQAKPAAMVGSQNASTFHLITDSGSPQYASGAYSSVSSSSYKAYPGTSASARAAMRRNKSQLQASHLAIGGVSEPGVYESVAQATLRPAGKTEAPKRYGAPKGSRVRLGDDEYKGSARTTSQDAFVAFGKDDRRAAGQPQQSVHAYASSLKVGAKNLEPLQSMNQSAYVGHTQDRGGALERVQANKAFATGSSMGRWADQDGHQGIRSLAQDSFVTHGPQAVDREMAKKMAADLRTSNIGPVGGKIGNMESTSRAAFHQHPDARVERMKPAEDSGVLNHQGDTGPMASDYSLSFKDNGPPSPAAKREYDAIRKERVAQNRGSSVLVTPGSTTADYYQSTHKSSFEVPVGVWANHRVPTDQELTEIVSTAPHHGAAASNLQTGTQKTFPPLR